MHKIYYSHNFGHNGPLDFHGLGINGKISELQAAMGLATLPYVDYIIEERKKVVEYYTSNLDFTRLKKMTLRQNTTWNYSYYPIIFESETQLLKVQKVLNENNIFPRRYFYPSLNKVNYVEYSEMPISERISQTILCLPLSHELECNILEKIVSLINSNI